MLSKMVFKGLIHFLQIFTGVVSASLIYSLFIGQEKAMWLFDMVYAVICWSILIWLIKQDKVVLEKKFRDFFFDEDEWGD